MKKTIIALTAATIMTPALVLADQDHRPTLTYAGPVEIVTVSELLKDTGMLAERDAVVEGRLIKQINADTYIFSDATGEIQVEVDDHVQLPQAINASTRLRLFGEYEGGRTPEIEVDHIQVL
ncbi:NirD/YgiW/YdeI family stress tolerance protein [Photobacterium sp. MCCC 1A19761]|uniref:YgiW/YdeI family stress tolerance OB fold protein n=1 Tax=Photobacterium sp. MCCC 1A19761 TaxID=3115000 RepID=UPI00307D5903